MNVEPRLLEIRGFYKKVISVTIDNKYWYQSEESFGKTTIRWSDKWGSWLIANGKENVARNLQGMLNLKVCLNLYDYFIVNICPIGVNVSCNTSVFHLKLALTLKYPCYYHHQMKSCHF